MNRFGTLTLHRLLTWRQMIVSYFLNLFTLAIKWSRSLMVPYSQLFIQAPVFSPPNANPFPLPMSCMFLNFSITYFLFDNWSWNNNCHVVFDSSCVRVKDNITGDVLLQASSSGPVYIVPAPYLCACKCHPPWVWQPLASMFGSLWSKYFSYFKETWFSSVFLSFLLFLCIVLLSQIT